VFAEETREGESKIFEKVRLSGTGMESKGIDQIN